MTGCMDCGAKYHSWPDFHVADETWQRYCPERYDGGLICLNCFAQRMVEQSEEEVANGTRLTRLDPVIAFTITGNATAGRS